MSKAATPEGTARRAAKVREAKTKSPGGRAVSRAEQQRRMNIIERLYLNGDRNQERVAAVLSAGIALDDGMRLRISRSRVLVYLTRIKERWSWEAAAERTALKAEHRKAVLSDLAGARADKQFGPVMQGHKHLAEVDGLVGPVRHEVSVQVAGVDASMFAGWTAEQLRRFVTARELPGEPAPAKANGTAPPNGSNGAGNGAGH